LLRRSPLALGPNGLDFRVSTLQAPENQLNCPRVPLVGFGSSSEAAQAPSCCRGPWFPKNPTPEMNRAPFCSASLEVSSPSACPRPGQRHELAEPARPNRLRLQVFATSWRLHPPRACRPCFMPDPLLGSPSRALFLPRSRTLFPAPFPSWRSNRLQGLAPRENPPPGSAV